MKPSRMLIALAAVALLSACSKKSEENVYTGVIEGTVVQVPALTGGQILDIRVDTGFEVKIGDTLAVIDATEIQHQYEALQAQEQELQVQLDIARTRLQSAKADLDYIQEKHRRLADLYAKNTVTKQALDDISNQLQRAKTAHNTARQSLATLSAKSQQLQAQMKTVLKKIGDATVLSPAAGIVSSKYFEPGEAVPPMSPVVEITAIRTVKVKIYIAEKLLPHVQINQPVIVRADGLDRSFEGRIAWISPKAEFTPKSILTPETRSSLVYAVEVRLDNPEGILKHGMPVEVEL